MSESEPPPESQSVTALLGEWRNGRQAAFDEASALVYSELRKLAARSLRRERQGHTLQPTDLVNEAFLRMIGPSSDGLQNRAHFIAIAALTMRQILVDHARRRGRIKRGGGMRPVTLSMEQGASPLDSVVDIIDLDDALGELAGVDPRKSRVLEMHFFADMSFDDIASVLGVHVNTVSRDARLARAWLAERLQSYRPPPR